MIVSATMDVYKSATVTFLPTPAKSHYTFSLRDFSRVIRGVMLVPNTRLKDPDKLIRLWIHETYRVFDDRLINNDDKYCILSFVYFPKFIVTLIEMLCLKLFMKPPIKIIVSI